MPAQSSRTSSRPKNIAIVVGVSLILVFAYCQANNITPTEVIEGLQNVVAPQVPSGNGSGGGDSGSENATTTIPTNTTEPETEPLNFLVLSDAQEKSEVVANITWDAVAPGKVVAKTYYVKNTAQKPISSISVAIQNCKPAELEQYLKVEALMSNSTTIKSQETQPVIIMLTVLEKAPVVRFSFDLAVTAIYD